MPKINGKDVEFRLRFPAKDNWDLPALLQRVGQIGSEAQGGVVDLQAAVPLLQRVVTSWGFEGSPSDAESYGNLDMFRELIPLTTAVAKYIGSLTSGEAESEPTSQ